MTDDNNSMVKEIIKGGLGVMAFALLGLMIWKGFDVFKELVTARNEAIDQHFEEISRTLKRIADHLEKP